MVVGIDLGTTNSVVAVADEQSVRVLKGSNASPLIPSVVSFLPDGNVMVGAEAKTRRLLDAKNTIYSVKRLIGRPFNSFEVKQARKKFAFDLIRESSGGASVEVRGETYTLPEISAFVLRKIRQIAEQELGEVCEQAVITVPANFNELQRSATKTAGQLAGLDVLRIVNEPTAAALAYGYGRGSNERIAVFDLGGGTFDITILQLSGDVFEVLGTAGDTFLGGDDIDLRIAEKLAHIFLETHRYDISKDAESYERIRGAAEDAKCLLSTQLEVPVKLEDLAHGEGGVGLTLETVLTRLHVEALSRPLLSRAFDVCEEAMKLAGVRPTQLDQVILVGGATRIPILRSMVRDYFGRNPLTEIDPDLVVAQGAAIQARTLGGARSAKKLGKMALKKAEGKTKTKTFASPVMEESVERVDSARAEESYETLDLEDLEEFEEVKSPAAAAPPPAPTALLLDVLPFALGVETVDGYCQHLIPRNAPIPTQQSKLFSTARDNQERVELRICQGDSSRMEDNQQLGVVVLDKLRAATRGRVEIEVTFVIDADGTLRVKALDTTTGNVQSSSIELIGAVDKNQLQALRDKLETKHVQ